MGNEITFLLVVTMLLVVALTTICAGNTTTAASVAANTRMRNVEDVTRTSIIYLNGFPTIQSVASTSCLALSKAFLVTTVILKVLCGEFNC